MQNLLQNAQKYEKTDILTRGSTITRLYMMDQIYCDSTGSYFSLEKWNDDYKKYTERIEENWGVHGLELDDKQRLRPNENYKAVDFNELWECLRSSDEIKL